MEQIRVMNVSHYKRELNNYHAKNEDGFGKNIYLFIHFIKPAVVTINGIDEIVNSNACIIYPPDHRMEYRHYNGVFINGFMIFELKDNNFFTRHGLPENEIFYITDGDEISYLLELITYSITDKLINRSSETHKHVIKLFKVLSKKCIDNNPQLKRKYEIRQRFSALRDEIKQDPKGWTVEKMAKRVWFTRSRFSVLYKEFMGVSPNVDLISIRIEYAKQMLTDSDKTVAEISKMSGYDSVEHFIRIFKSQVKETPLKYRKNIKINEMLPPQKEQFDNG